MKINQNKDRIIIYINNKLIDFNLIIKQDLEQFIKKIVLKLKKIKNMKISGFYKVLVYQNNNYGLILNMIKQDSFDFFPDLIDLKLIVYYDSEFYLKFDDYFLIENKEIFTLDNYYYIKVNDLNEKELLSLIEFSSIIYDLKENEIKKLLRVTI